MNPYPDKYIPDGDKCSGCYYTWMSHGNYWFCALFDTATEVRTEDCIAALPNGGIVETVVKERFTKEERNG